MAKRESSIADLLKKYKEQGATSLTPSELMQLQKLRTKNEKADDITPRQPADRDGWYRTVEAASIFGVARQVFHATYRPHIPASAMKTVGKHTLVHMPSAIRGWTSHREKAATEAAAPGKDSPALERSRELDVKLKQIELDEQLKTHVPLAELNPAIGQLSQILRTAGQRLQRQFGNAAGEILNQAIDEFETRVTSVIPQPTTTAANAAGATDASINTTDAGRV